MAGCCPSGDYHRFFNQRFAHRYGNRGLDQAARKMVAFLQELGIQGSSVLEIGGGVGELEIELLKAGAARAQNLELSPAYQNQARELAAQAGLQGRIDWRILDLAQDPGAVEPADLVVLHRVVCCYPDYQRLLAAAADHARRALVFSYPPSNPLSRAFYVVFNLVMRLTRSGFRGFAHPPGGDAWGAGGPRPSADLPAPRPDLAGRRPRARLVRVRRPLNRNLAGAAGRRSDAEGIVARSSGRCPVSDGPRASRRPSAGRRLAT